MKTGISMTALLCIIPCLMYHIISTFFPKVFHERVKQTASWSTLYMLVVDSLRHIRCNLSNIDMI